MSQYSSRRISGFSETVFSKYTALANQYQAINLGQGFPNFGEPEIIMNAYREAAHDYQQYAPGSGMPVFNRAAAAAKSKIINRAIDPDSEIQVTVGATEALFAIAQAFINPGDEVILIEPFYDAYPADVIMAGGIPKYIALMPQSDGSWQLDFDELDKLFSDKTKAIFINTPHNPTGKVFDAAEIDKIIALADKYDALIISDEPYEYAAFKEHVSPLARPGGWQRSLAISSIGKTFSVTGWKIGYIVGPAELINDINMAHQWIPFAVATPLQIASAKALEIANRDGSSYFANFRELFIKKRDLLKNALQQSAFRPLKSDGTYFIIADSSALGYKDDIALCDDMPKRFGVAAIPPSAFYSDEHKHLAKNLVRFAFCKTDEMLIEAGKRLVE